MTTKDNVNLTVQYLKTKDLIPYIHNAKKHPRKQIEQIAKSISQFGNCDPIAIWHNDRGEAEIVEGHGRLLALQELGIDEAPCVCLDHLTDKERRAYTHIHNQLNSNSKTDDSILSHEMTNMQDFNWADFGFNINLIETEIKDDKFKEAPDKKVNIKQGDMFELGNHRLLCGDSTDYANFEKLLQGEIVDLCMTDPPYNIDYDENRHHRGTECRAIQNDNLTDNQFDEFLKSVFLNIDKSLKPGGAFYIWHTELTVKSFLLALDKTTLQARESLIWVKGNFTFGRQDYQWRHEPCLYGWKDGAKHHFAFDRSQSTIFDDSEIDIDQMTEAEAKAKLREAIETIKTFPSTAMHEPRPKKNDIHPTMKPVPLLCRLIKNSSAVNQIVIDPFGGSGSTLIACEQLGRKARIIEFEPVYVQSIIDRWQKFTGKKARKIND